MQIHLLVMEEMKPIPKNIKVLFDWDEVGIVTDKKTTVSGTHMMVEGTEEALKAWLSPFDAVWVGKGAPQLQNFQVMHIA
jgi:hypothetical protein